MSKSNLPNYFKIKATKMRLKLSHFLMIFVSFIFIVKTILKKAFCIKYHSILANATFLIILTKLTLTKKFTAEKNLSG